MSMTSLVPHLNDHFFMAHRHEEEDGFAYLDEEWRKEQAGADDGGDTFRTAPNEVTGPDGARFPHRGRGTTS